MLFESRLTAGLCAGASSQSFLAVAGSWQLAKYQHIGLAVQHIPLHQVSSVLLVTVAQACGEPYFMPIMARDEHDANLIASHEMAMTSPEHQRSRSTARTLLEVSHVGQSLTSNTGKLEADPLLVQPPQGNSHPKPVFRAKVATALVVFAWFCSNIGLLLMNKFLLSNYGFKQPVFLTLCHMLACVILSTAFSATQYVPKKSVQSNKQLMKVALLAAVFATSVVLGNVSLRFIPVSFSQVGFCIIELLLCAHVIHAHSANVFIGTVCIF